MKLHKIGLSLLSLGMVAALAGCGGGNGNGPLAPTNPTPSPTAANQRFNGQYTGNFAGVTAQGQPVQGTFDNNVSGTGQTTGTIKQTGLPDFNATGTIDTNGILSATATPPGLVSTLTGTTTLSNGGAVASGTLTTSQGATVVVNGIFAGARVENTANSYAGNYTGSFDGGGDIKGTFTGVADRNGSVSGTVTQPGLGQYPLVGTIDRAGNLSVRAINSFPGQPSIILLTTLTGKAIIVSGVASAVGTFTTTANGQPNASGTFKAQRS